MEGLLPHVSVDVVYLRGISLSLLFVWYPSAWRIAEIGNNIDASGFMGQ